MTITHDSSIEWPNGEGWTPCSKEYAAVNDEIDDLNDFGRIGMDDMSPDDYEKYNRLDDKRNGLLLAGHVGKSERY